MIKKTQCGKCEEEDVELYDGLCIRCILDPFRGKTVAIDHVRFAEISTKPCKPVEHSSFNKPFHEREAFFKKIKRSGKVGKIYWAGSPSWGEEIIKAYAEKYGYTLSDDEIDVRDMDLTDADIVICHLSVDAITVVLDKGARYMYEEGGELIEVTHILSGVV